MKKALLYKSRTDSTVLCLVCSHKCIISPGQTGLCNVRMNKDGILYTLNYAKLAAINSDPIEKKPLYHFLPGSLSLSMAAMGCNFRCSFCQNHSLSQVKNPEDITGDEVTPRQIIETAKKNNSLSISYTYSEPTVYFEYMYETAVLAREAGIKNIMVTNGYLSGEAFAKISPFLDGANIDLKAFNQTFYHKYCKAGLQPVLDTISRMKENNIWIELTTLLIPDLNSDMEEIRKLISFIADIDPDPPTSSELIFKVLDIAKEEGLRYLYAGNINSDNYSNTYCLNCQALLIERSGYFTRLHDIRRGICTNCQNSLPGVWD